MRLILLIAAFNQLTFLFVNAQSDPKEFPKLIKIIFEEKTIEFKKIDVPELGNPDIIIQKNDIVASLFDKDLLVSEISQQSPRAFILDYDYIFGYKIKSFIEFTEVKIGSRKATLKFKTNGFYQAKRCDYIFKKKKGKWLLASVKKS